MGVDEGRVEGGGLKRGLLDGAKTATSIRVRVRIRTDDERQRQTCRDIHVRVIMRCAPFSTALLSLSISVSPASVTFFSSSLLFSLINKMELHF